eukprot:scaffold205143_cov19-Tisochrysis_lutea.AAC.2
MPGSSTGLKAGSLTESQTGLSCSHGWVFDWVSDWIVLQSWLGMTGSGKTYTMSGREEVICQDGYKGDTKDGIVTQSVNYLYRQ